MYMLQSCCCGCSLRTGTLIIGYLSLIFCLLGIFGGAGGGVEAGGQAGGAASKTSYQVCAVPAFRPSPISIEDELSLRPSEVGRLSCL